MEEMAPGFRFYPTEDELMSFYLPNKLAGKRNIIDRVIPVFDIYQLEPWQLPEHCGELCQGDTEQWFFFVPRTDREVRGGRPSRTTFSGYWKATGSPSHVYSAENKRIGLKKSMVFYRGKAPNGRKTKWKMNEYRAIEQDLPHSIPKLRHELSLCRIYVGSGTVRAFDRRPTHHVSEPVSSGEVNTAEENEVDADTNQSNLNATTNIAFDGSSTLILSDEIQQIINNNGTDHDQLNRSMETNNTNAGLGFFNNLEDLMDWDDMHI